MSLSVALAVFNEEKNIKKCLESVKDWADEIVVVDGGSADRTTGIIKEYGAKILVTDNPPIFHINKQKALDLCTKDWILQLDADEVVSEELKNEINTIISNESSLSGIPQAPGQPATDKTINGYYLPRKNYFLGAWLKKGGLYPDYVMRLIRKGKGKFPCKNVHEQIDIDGEVEYLKSALLHNTNPTISDYWKNSVKRYANLSAKELKDNNQKNSLGFGIKYLIALPIKEFFTRYIRHKGILDGFPGLIFALGSAIHYPLAHIMYLKLDIK